MRAMLPGYGGRVLKVDLGSRELVDEPLAPEEARTYLGGRGLAAKTLFEAVPPSIDAYDPRSALVFAAGPLTGTFVPATSRFHVAGKSPLTGAYGESNGGGGFGVQMKRAGYDMIVITGRSEAPVYLMIDGAGPRLRDALGLWGRFTGEAEDLIKAEEGDKGLWIATIGPAGEKLARIAGVISGGNRAAARTGLGAVMGSKRLKAVAVRGEKRVSIADPEALRELTKKMAGAIQTSAWAQGLREDGTSIAVDVMNYLGAMPTMNFREGVFEGAEAINGRTLTKTLLSARLSCPGCPVRCIRSVDVAQGPYGNIDGRYGGPEYETMAAFGSLCCNQDQMAIAKAHEICNMYGVDTMSAGVVVAWVMECYERGILTASELDGIEARWGDPRAVLRLVEKVCKREGIGELLSEGVRRAAETVGRGSEDFAVHVKGLEASLSDPRGKKGVALIYGTGPRGAAHTESAHDPAFEKENALPELGIVRPVDRLTFEGKAALFKTSMDLRTFVSASGGCFAILDPLMSIVSLTDLVGLVAATTGWRDMSVEEAMRIGERANNVARAFNARAGLRREDDLLPKRFSQAFTKGASAGERIDPGEYSDVLGEYYKVRGWTSEGIPSGEKLRALGLHWIASELAALEAPGGAARGDIGFADNSGT